jgi:cytochrome oxidase Cu insertion factor (SCO1/SenC/PrrC family)
VEPEPGSENYLVDHTAAVFLFDPDGRYHAVFTPPLSAENIASDFRKMLQATQ